jgi:hypothetical protein
VGNTAELVAGKGLLLRDTKSDCGMPCRNSAVRFIRENATGRSQSRMDLANVE